jgi:ubiquinol-cytochrome c reductase subunit 10
VGSTAVFGASVAVLGLYFTDWKVIVRYIPYYGGKFKEDDS